jgi:hypothetical protein
VSSCEQCGATLTQTFKGRPRRYCGPACRKAAHRARQEAFTYLEEMDPQLAKMPTLADMYKAEHGDDFDIKAWWADMEARGVVPPKLDRQIAVAGADREATPSPEGSTVEDVLATVWAAIAVLVELRRHALVAPGLLAPKCARVASALDAALAEEFPKK